MITKTKTTSSRLRHRLTLQQETDTTDGAGGSQRSWSDVVDLWAEIIPAIGGGSGTTKTAGKKIVFGGQIEAEISHRILLRYQSSPVITTSMRLVYESRIFNIKYVANVEERKDMLELLVQEGIAT